MTFAISMTTCPTRAEAQRLSKGIVVNKLAACVQISEISSVYKWKGKVNKKKEFLLIIKGKKGLFPKLKKYLLANHSYEVPELVQLDIVDGNPRYLKWMSEQG